MTQPMTPLRSPRKIGSALAAFENTISQNRHCGAETSKNFLTGVVKTPGGVSPLKKTRLLSYGTVVGEDDASTCKETPRTPVVSNKQRMAALSTVKVPAFPNISESTCDSASPRQETATKSPLTPSKTRIEATVPSAIEASEISPVSEGPVATAARSGALRPRKVHTSPALLFQRRDLPDIPETQPREERDITFEPERILEEPDDLRPESIYFPTTPAKGQNPEDLLRKCTSPTDTCSTASTITETSMESQAQHQRESLIIKLRSASAVLELDADTGVEDFPSKDSLLGSPRRVRPAVSGMSSDDGTVDSISTMGSGRPPRSPRRHVVTADRHKLFGIPNAMDCDTSCSTAATPESPTKTKVRRRDGDSPKKPVRARESSDDYSYASSSGSLSPGGATAKSPRRKSPKKKKKSANEAAVSALPEIPVFMTPTKVKKKSARKMQALKAEQESLLSAPLDVREQISIKPAKGKRLKRRVAPMTLQRNAHSDRKIVYPISKDTQPSSPVKSSLNWTGISSKRGMRVTFADEQPVKPRSMMTLCAKDSTPKQPRRNSMTNLEEVKKSPCFLQDPVLVERRSRRTATKIQDWWRKMIPRRRVKTTKAVIVIQALFRGSYQRKLRWIAKLEQMVALSQRKCKRDLLRVQSKKWKKMEVIRNQADTETREEEERLSDEGTAIDKVSEQLERENGKIRDQNSKIEEASFLLKRMNDQIEETLMIHNQNFTTMRDAVGIMTERNAKSIETKQKYEKRIDKVKQELSNSTRCSEYATTVRKSMEKSISDIIVAYESRATEVDQEFLDQLIFMSGAIGTHTDEGSLVPIGEAGDEEEEPSFFELSFRVSDEMTIWSDVSSFRALDDVLAPLKDSLHSQDTGYDFDGSDDDSSDQSSVYVDTTAVDL